ncbi:class I SAM-dependent methyltransferase [Brevibacillus reuszeri]|uniref:class I SAM-dependent methyltransferase n=1 Tax=Brevibacillus reuszeri TaxID=54915 RepID=UPI000CCC705A|nr:class I SAM-dependent methyltransferase [Brevibacillus reuszeri]
MNPPLTNPKNHPDWIAPHSLNWYAQLASLSAEYVYPWRSTVAEPNGESLFTQEVAYMVQNKKVLDIGCGHGAFTLRWASVARELVGVDVTNRFVQTAKEMKQPNVSFVVSNTKEPLPFAAGEFDCAYNRKGPTSAYLHCKQVIKAGGQILGLHPADQLFAELPEWFPDLFEPHPSGTPILDLLQDRLRQASFSHVDIESVTSTEYILSPLDVIKLRCFGQQPSVTEQAIAQHLESVQRIFDQHTTANGLPVTFAHYFVRVIV